MSIIRVAIYIIGGVLIGDPAGMVYLDPDAGHIVLDVDAVSAAAAAAIAGALAWWRRDVKRGRAT